jgi:rRNA small subunit pseudouridine methyltransferase Nep1
MLSLRDADRRGRPDIVHLCLLNALGTPLNKEQMLCVYVHTLNDEVISVAPEVRLPRNYNRFTSLVEQLYQTHHVPTEGKSLMEIQSETLQNLLRRLHPSRVIALSVLGEQSTTAKVMEPLVSEENPAILVGGFPRGHLSAQVTRLSDAIVSIDPEGLDAWIVVSRLLYEYEKQSGLPEKRWNQRPKE